MAKGSGGTNQSPQQGRSLDDEIATHILNIEVDLLKEIKDLQDKGVSSFADFKARIAVYSDFVQAVKTSIESKRCSKHESPFE